MLTVRVAFSKFCILFLKNSVDPDQLASNELFELFSLELCPSQKPCQLYNLKTA